MGIYAMGRACLPNAVKTCLGMATKPITWTISKLTGWESIWDFLADENSICRWLTTRVGLGGMCGFTDSEICDSETRFIAKAINLAKERALVMSKGETYPSDKEKVYKETMESLTKKLKTPNSFTINSAVYITDFIPKLPLNKEEIAYGCRKGVKHLNTRNVSACINVFVKYAYIGKKDADAQSTMNLYGDDMMAAWALVSRIKSDFERQKILKEKHELRLKSKADPIAIKLAPEDPKTAGKRPVPQPKKTKDTSKNRKDTDFWVFLFVASLVMALAGAAWFVGMGRAPSSDYPMYVGGFTLAAVSRPSVEDEEPLEGPELV